MLKVLVLLGVVAAGALPAMAGEPDAAIVSRWSDAQYVCRMHETRDGIAVSEPVVDENCQERAALDERLTQDGFCWDAAEQEWFTSTNGACEPARLN